MANPYSSLPATAFWRRSVSALSAEDLDPVTDVPFTIGRKDKVATAGSCFAQHISRTLVADGFFYYVTEKAPLTDGAIDENYGIFPARFANIYTVRQLLQLFQRAYGLFEPADAAWRADDGSWMDPFRPRIQTGNFSTRASVVVDRNANLAATRRMFERSDIFIFTLGLTEAWVSPRDGSVFPLAPGVVTTKSDPDTARFRNFTVGEMTNDLSRFVECLRRVNPQIRIILTVSPVPLIATYEERHVLVSTIASKSALRVVADEVSQTAQGVTYFPSYEIITGPQAGARYYENDLRQVSDDGVAHVMKIFRRHYLTEAREGRRSPTALPVRAASSSEQWARHVAPDALNDRLAALDAVVCDEDTVEEAERCPAAQ